MRANSIRFNNQDFVGGEDWQEVGVDNFRPYVERVVVTPEGAPQAALYDRRWELSGDKLVPVAGVVDGPLLPGGRYAVTAQLSEYGDHLTLRLSDGVQVTGVTETLDHEAHLSRYSGVLALPEAYSEDKVLGLVIEGADGAENQLLALAPGRASIDPALELTRGATGAMQGVGGEDRYHYVRVDAAPPVIGYNKLAPVVPGYQYSCQGAVAEQCGTPALPVLVRHNDITFRLEDKGSGINTVRIYKEGIGGELVGGGPMPHAGSDIFGREMRVALKDGRYAQVVTDNLGRAT